MGNVLGIAGHRVRGHMMWHVLKKGNKDRVEEERVQN